jgi:hypothetical protein
LIKTFYKSVIFLLTGRWANILFWTILELSMPKKSISQNPVLHGGDILRNFSQRRWATLRVASAEYGISVPELFRLCVSGEVKAAHRLKPGKKRGTWLINCQSLEDYITSFTAGGLRHILTPDRTP